jgi:hypothetical protein
LIEKNEQVFVMVAGYLFVKGCAGLGLRHPAVGWFDLKDDHTGKLGNLTPLIAYALVREGDGLPAGRLGPPQFFYEQRLEIKSL